MSELKAHPEKTIKALEAKLAIAKGESDGSGDKRLIAWYDKHAALDWSRAIPRSVYCQLAVRQQSQLTDQAAKYGLPVTAGACVDLSRVLLWFHNFLSEFGPKITQNKLVSDSGSLEDVKRKLEIRQLEVRIQGLESDVARKQGESVPMSEVDKMLRWLSAEFRKMGERLGKRFGREVQLLFNESLERIENELKIE